MLCGDVITVLPPLLKNLWLYTIHIVDCTYIVIAALFSNSENKKDDEMKVFLWLVVVIVSKCVYMQTNKLKTIIFSVA